MRLRLDSPINLAADDTEDEDEDLELARPAPLPRPRSTQQQIAQQRQVQPQGKPLGLRDDAGRRSRKRPLERASVSCSDESDVGSGSGPGSGGGRSRNKSSGGGFKPPTPVRIRERRQEGLQFFMEPSRLERTLGDAEPAAASQADRHRQDAGDPAAVSAARTLVCSQRFGRCQLRFRSDRVKLQVWKATGTGSKKDAWAGDVLYSQIGRLWYVSALMAGSDGSSLSSQRLEFDEAHCDLCA